MGAFFFITITTGVLGFTRINSSSGVVFGSKILAPLMRIAAPLKSVVFLSFGSMGIWFGFIYPDGVIQRCFMDSSSKNNLLLTLKVLLNVVTTLNNTVVKTYHRNNVVKT